MEKQQSVSCVTALGSLAMVAVVIAFALHYPSASNEWAAWVQVIGSVAAILVTGSLFILQNKAVELRTQQAEDARELMLLELVQDDLNRLKSGFLAYLGQKLQSERIGQGFSGRMRNQQSSDLFRVLIEKGGAIRDRSLRRQILATYTELGSLRLVINTNTDLIERYLDHLQSSKLLGGSPGQSVADRIASELMTDIERHGALVNGSYRRALREVRAASIALEKWFLERDQVPKS